MRSCSLNYSRFLTGETYYKNNDNLFLFKGINIKYMESFCLY